MSVGKRIRALRAKSGISNQEELAYLVGTARQTVSSWERDIFLPDGANLNKALEGIEYLHRIYHGRDAGPRHS